MSDSRGAAELNDAQQAVLSLIGAPRNQRPSFEPGLRERLASEMEHRLGPVAANLAEGDSLFASKHTLSSVHGCEARFLAAQHQPFAWTVPMARGTVVHKAIELSVTWPGEPAPIDIIDEAIARLENDDSSLAEFLQGCTEGDLADLGSQVNAMFSDFQEDWPPLQREWRPVAESRVRVELSARRIVLAGRVDLTLGRSEGRVAGKVLVDFKTGGFNLSHMEDLRFYALLETLKHGTPPRLVASYYLDQARFHTEDVTVGILEAAAARTADGVSRIAELADSPDSAVKRTGRDCRWCLLLDNCREGTSYLEDYG